MKNLKTAHCIVNLYKSVSRKDITPSGKGEELLKSIITVGGILFASCGSPEVDEGEIGMISNSAHVGYCTKERNQVGPVQEPVRLSIDLEEIGED